MSVLIYATHGHISFPFEGSAGLTRGKVRVEFTGLPDSFRIGEVLPGSVSLRTAGKTAILEYLPNRETPNLVVITLHRGSAGRFGAWGGCLSPNANSTLAIRLDLLPTPTGARGRLNLLPGR